MVRFRVPTALERQGDFSQTTDNNGNLFPYIKDPLLVAAPARRPATAACFADGGVLGRIPANRLYQTGQNILNLYPLPNIATRRQVYNYEMTRPEQSLTSWQPVVRIDYQPLHGAARHLQVRRLGPAERADPRLDSRVQRHPDERSGRAALVGDGELHAQFDDVHRGELRARLASPGGLRAQRQRRQLLHRRFSGEPGRQPATNGLSGLPGLFPDANVIDPSYYNYDALTEVSPENFDGTRVLLPPSFQWGGRVARHEHAAEQRLSRASPTTRRSRTSPSASPRSGAGTRSRPATTSRTPAKRQNQGNPFGTLNFGNDANNPLDSGFGFANAALGIFSSYNQASRFVEGQYSYTNDEAYIQDNWKVSNRLTLDYGMRFVHQQPQYETTGQASNFLPEEYSRGAAPLLYVAGCANGVYPCSGTNRQAMNPLTGQFLGTELDGRDRRDRAEHRRPDQRHLRRRAGHHRRRRSSGR